MPEPGVFISYARDTKPLAESLSRALEERGIASWTAFNALQPGQRWRDEMERALKDADSFLILVGPDRSPSPFVQAEWQAALTEVWSDPHKILIPIVFEGAEPPPFLRNWVPLRVDPGTEPSKWIPRVVDALQSRRTEVAERVSPDAQAERIERWQEIGRAARLLRESEPDSETPAGLQG
jgi:hypothetical protein